MTVLYLYAILGRIPLPSVIHRAFGEEVPVGLDFESLAMADFPAGPPDDDEGEHVASSGVRERISCGRGAGRRTIGLRGPLKGPRIGALREAALAAIEPDVDLIVDMSEVTDIDAVGLAVLDDVAVRARTDGRSFFVRPPVANKALFNAVAAITASTTEMARRDHPAGRHR